MKVYETKNTQEDANVLDCLSDMAISGPVDDFYAYTKEWTRVVNINIIVFIRVHHVQKYVH